MQTFFITTLGCKVNQYESELIAQSLMNKGWLYCKEDADLCIINTCTVTQKAAMQSRQAVRQMIRAHPRSRIIVTGCYAQTEPEQIQNINGVHAVIAHQEKLNIPHIIKHGNTEPNKIIQFQNPDVQFQMSNSRTRAFLKIQDGCNAFCTYCIVPYARGRSRSMSFEDVLSCISRLKDSGYHEAVLSGIHLGQYGLDLSPKVRLLDVLTRICDANLIDRIRLSSIEPAELSEEIIKLAAGSKNMCHHFHIPLQSGDNRILQQMHRPYTRELFSELVMKIHTMIPDAAVGVDVLIGFPGEDDEAFENTYTLIKELPVSYLHVFPFSPRKGTPASTFPNQVPSQTIKFRCHQMRELGKIKKKDFYQRFVGKKLEILVETKRDKATGLLKGMSSNYIPVFINGSDDLKNSLQICRL